jgi:hypothetical protein
MLTPYQFASNTPIMAIDLDGMEAFAIVGVQKDGASPEIVITADAEVEDNYSCDFQLRLPDGSVHKDWAVDGLIRQMKDFKKEGRDYFLGREKISDHPAVQSGNEGEGHMKMNDFTLRIPVKADEFNYMASKVVAKAHWSMNYGSKSSIKSVDEMTVAELVKDIGAVGGNDIKFNRLDVYVPDDKKEAFLSLACSAGIERNQVNFVNQKMEGSTMEILPVRVEPVVQVL